MEVLQQAAKTHSPDDGGEIIPVGPCDVTSKEELEKLVADISKKEKYINLLITNAGISGPKAPPDSSSAEEVSRALWKAEDPSAWSSVFNTNVTSVYFSVLAFLPLLQASFTSKPDETPREFSPRSASVIVISSMSGLMRSAQGHFSYNAAKGATVHLSKLMSAEFERCHVRVNSIAPGYFPSEMTTGASDDRTQKSELSDDKVQAKGHVPAGRAGNDEEMAQAVLFLTKCAYVNGEVVAVDGGVLNQVAGR